MLLKIMGILLMAFGLLMIIYFPTTLYQRSMMSKSGLWFGVMIFLIGISLVVFA